MSEGRLSGKVAIVTGAGQGIGEGIARVFAAEGASVVVATRTEKSGQATVDAIMKAGGDAILITVDLGSRAACEAMVADSLAAYGRIDILVHNAAVYPVHLIEDLSDADLDATVDVNLKACFWLTQAVVPTMRAQGGGRLLFTSSVTGPRVAIPGTAHYAATKGAVNGFIRTAALEFAPDKITANGVEPGFIRTPALDALGDAEALATMERYIPEGSMGKPADIAHAMLYLASDEAHYVTGQTIVVDGGSTLPESPFFKEALEDARAGAT